MSEKQEQKKVCEYLKKLDIFFFSIAAVPFSIKQGGYPIGYKKGMPDLMIPSLKLFIEMKDIKAGKVKEHEELQEQRRKQLIKDGYHAERCEGFEKARELIDKLRSNENKN